MVVALWAREHKSVRDSIYMKETFVYIPVVARGENIVPRSSLARDEWVLQFDERPLGFLLFGNV